MARKIPKSVARREIPAVEANDPALLAARTRHAASDRSNGAAGGAWAAAGTAVLSAEVRKLQDDRTNRLLSGNYVVELAPDQIEDEVGSDRSSRWIDDPSFLALKTSIKENGQDVPIQVTPADPDWVPLFNETDGVVLEGIRFKIISGRRRLAALREIERKVRAVCVCVEKQVATFEQLHRRYRENAERENLTLFDELMAIGELFAQSKLQGEKITGRGLARLLSAPEAKISRAKAVFEHRDRIFEELAEPHLLTLHQLDTVIPALRSGAPLPEIAEAPTKIENQHLSKRPKQPETLKRTQIIRGRKIVAKARAGKITLDLGAEADVDQNFLDKLLLFIQTEKRTIE